MKVVHIETLISAGPYSVSDEWQQMRAAIKLAVEKVNWPPAEDAFIVYPVVDANGVAPIRRRFVEIICSPEFGWSAEQPLKLEEVRWKPGELDAVFETEHGIVAVEWETGNVSSSHRAVTKLTIGIERGALAAGVVVVPARALARFLTQRVGNYEELRPYFDQWRRPNCKTGVLEIMVMVHDAEDMDSPPIPKGNDGRAQEARRKREAAG